MERGIGLEADRLVEGGAYKLVGLLEQVRRQLVTFPEFVGIARQVALPAEGAEQEAPLPILVLRIERGFVQLRHQSRATDELFVQFMTGRVDVIHAYRRATVDGEDHMRDLQRRADVVDACQLREAGTAVDARQVVRRLRLRIAGRL
ncbi:hypothetical protein D3C81_1709590 [compost metagenome]